jgi:hypothetical protein
MAYFKTLLQPVSKTKKTHKISNMVHWYNILSLDLVHRPFVFLNTKFWKPALFLSSGKELPNLVDPWDRVMGSNRATCSFMKMEAQPAPKRRFFNIRRWTTTKKEDCVSESYTDIKALLCWTDSSTTRGTHIETETPPLAAVSLKYDAWLHHRNRTFWQTYQSVLWLHECDLMLSVRILLCNTLFWLRGTSGFQYLKITGKDLDNIIKVLFIHQLMVLIPTTIH